MRQRLLTIKLVATLLTFTCISMGTYAETVTYTQTSKTEITLSAGTAPDGASAEFSTTYTKINQLTGGNSMTYTLSGFDGCTIKGVTLKMRSNKSEGKGSLEIKINDNSVATIEDSKFNTENWYGSWSTTYVDITPTITETAVEKDGKISITIAASENSLYCLSVTIEYTTNSIAAPTLPESTNFTTSKTIEITNNTEGATIYYTTDGTEPTTGSAQYAEAFTITETTTVMAIAVKDGESSITASATYTKIEEEASAIVSFSINGIVDEANSINRLKGEELSESSLPKVTLPKGISLLGWSLSESSSETVTFPIAVTDDMTLYAVFIQGFQLVTDVAELNAGDQVIIACPSSNTTISTNDMIISGNACAQNTPITIKDNTLFPTEKTRIFTLGKDGDYFTFTGDGYYLICPENDNRLDMQTSPKGNNELWEITITDGVSTITNQAYPRSIKYNSQYPRFACYQSGQTPVSIYKGTAAISTNYTSISISSVGYATMYLADAVAVPTEVEAYIATGVEGNYLSMEQVKGTLPSETGIILKAEEGEYGFIHSSSATSDVSRNLLKGTLQDEDISGTGYVLSAPDGAVGLYLAKQTDGKFLNNANKAYLPGSAVAATQQSNGFRFKIGETTDIAPPFLNSQPSTVIYDLTGRRVEKMDKGIYIVNGRKVVVK